MQDGAPSGSGFDAVIGNPPYIRIQALREWAPLEADYFPKQQKDGPRYVSASQGNYDIYVMFVERAMHLLRKNGRMGYILPHKFFNAQYGAPLRGLLAPHLSDVVHFGHAQVFENATTYTCLLFAAQSKGKTVNITRVDDLAAWRLSGQAVTGAVPTASLSSAAWNFAVGSGGALFDKLAAMPVKLGDVAARIFQGIKTSADKIYIVEELQREKKRVKIYSRQTEAEHWLEPNLLHPLVKGGDSKRYNLSRTKRLILFPYAKQEEANSKLIPAATLEEQCPLTWAYLLKNKDYLQEREDGKMRGAGWYGYGRVQALDVMPLPKMFTPDIAARSAFSLDETGEAFFTGGVSGGYGILVKDEHSRAYVLGLLNSRLLEWFNRQTATIFRGGYYSYEARFIKQLPIRAINFADAADKARHDNMVSLVETMLELQQRAGQESNPATQGSLARRIQSTDAQIDALVYELYGLSEDEIALVEG